MALRNYNYRRGHSVTQSNIRHLTLDTVLEIEANVFTAIRDIYDSELRRLTNLPHFVSISDQVCQDILWSFLTTAAHRGTSDFTVFGTISFTSYHQDQRAAVDDDDGNVVEVAIPDTDFDLRNRPLIVSLDVPAAIISGDPRATIRRYCGFYAVRVLEYGRLHQITWDWGSTNNLSPSCGYYGFDFWNWLPRSRIPAPVYSALQRASTHAINQARTNDQYDGSETTIGK
jgi:hypothetical protein